MQDPIFITTQSRLTATVETAVQKAVRAVLAARPEASTEKRWLTSAEGQAYLGLSKATLARYRAGGRLQYAKVGSSVYYRLTDIEALIAGGARGARPHADTRG